jgi:cytidine deaminase
MDWKILANAAKDAARCAYVPYSQYPVGAAALVDDGRIVSGCNVENASYGLTLCAECGLVSSLAASGGGRLVAFVCVNGLGEAITPCGRCRQLLLEHGGTKLLLLTPQGEATLGEMLPQAFGPWELEDYSAASGNLLLDQREEADRD